MEELIVKYKSYAESGRNVNAVDSNAIGCLLSFFFF